MITETWEEWKSKVVNIAGLAWTDLIGQRFKGVLDLSSAQSVIMPTGANALTFQTGTWTPVLTFATPGDLAVTYATQLGNYIKIGRLVYAPFTIVTSAYTFTTAIGNMQINGIPFTTMASGARARGSLEFSGIIKAGYTNFTSVAGLNATNFNITASGSGVANAAVTAADTVTGTNVTLIGSIVYMSTT